MRHSSKRCSKFRHIWECWFNKANIQTCTVNLKKGLYPAKCPKSIWLENLFAKHLTISRNTLRCCSKEKLGNSFFYTNFDSTALPFFISDSQDVKSCTLPYIPAHTTYIAYIRMYKYTILYMCISFIFWSIKICPSSCFLLLSFPNQNS